MFFHLSLTLGRTEEHRISFTFAQSPVVSPDIIFFSFKTRITYQTLLRHGVFIIDLSAGFLSNNSERFFCVGALFLEDALCVCLRSFACLSVCEVGAHAWSGTVHHPPAHPPVSPPSRITHQLSLFIPDTHHEALYFLVRVPLISRGN